MLKKNLFLMMFIVLILSMTLAVAQPVYKQNTEVLLSLPCTINGALCSPSAVCQFSLTTPSGITLFNKVNMTQDGGLFTYQLLANETVEVGSYEFPVTCCDTGNKCATRYLTFTITPSGAIGSSGEAITYTILILVVLVLLILSIIGAVKTNGDDKYDIGGNLLDLNYGKYLKMGLFFLSVLFLWFLLFLGWQTAEKILMFSFMLTIFHTCFMILTYLLAPVFIVFVILALIKWTADLKLWKLAERGLKER